MGQDKSICGEKVEIEKSLANHEVVRKAFVKPECLLAVSAE